MALSDSQRWFFYSWENYKFICVFHNRNCQKLKRAVLKLYNEPSSQWFETKVERVRNFVSGWLSFATKGMQFKREQHFMVYIRTQNDFFFVDKRKNQFGISIHPFFFSVNDTGTTLWRAQCARDICSVQKFTSYNPGISFMKEDVLALIIPEDTKYVQAWGCGTLSIRPNQDHQAQVRPPLAWVSPRSGGWGPCWPSVSDMASVLLSIPGCPNITQDLTT